MTLSALSDGHWLTETLHPFTPHSKCIKLGNRVTAGQEDGNNEDKVSFQRCDPIQAVCQKTINN